MCIDTVPNRCSRPTILLREGKRQGKKIIKRTLLNLTDWPPDRIQALRWLLADRPVAPIDDLFVIERSLPHDASEVVGDVLPEPLSAAWTRDSHDGHPDHGAHATPDPSAGTPGPGSTGPFPVAGNTFLP